MQDTALYQYLVGLKLRWAVSRVDLNVKGQCVEVWAEHPEGAAWACPHCSRGLPLYDHAEERTWRHRDSCQYQTRLHARIPRVACGERGVGQVTVPWAEARSRFTLLFGAILPYDQHPVTNAMSEGLNSKMQKIRSIACGFGNLENFKTAIYFHCGGLDLDPC